MGLWAVLPTLLVPQGFPENWRVSVCLRELYAQRTNRQPVTKTVTSLEQPSFHTAEALKIVERVKGIKPSLSAWGDDNEIASASRGQD